GITAVTAGANHSLAVRSDGTVWAWGDDEYGQLGDGGGDIGTNFAKEEPGQEVGRGGQGVLTGVIAIDASHHRLALESDGTVWAWGNNSWGQLGDGGWEYASNTPVQVLSPDGFGYLTGVIAIAAGANHSLALKSDGTVWA